MADDAIEVKAEQPAPKVNVTITTNDLVITVQADQIDQFVLPELISAARQNGPSKFNHKGYKVTVKSAEPT
jgi:hypothetical protein